MSTTSEVPLRSAKPADLHAPILVGCAGWTIRGDQRGLFPGEGSHLVRYARRFDAVEINSSFYRAHRGATYRRWAEAVPPWFRFAVKLPREITHDLRLSGAVSLLERFLEGVLELGSRLGPLLIQLPPGFEYDERVATGFLFALRERFAGSAVLEPRHPSWFGGRVEALLRQTRIARVAADPAVVAAAAEPGGWSELAYYRLHGSPLLYASSYGEDRLDGYARRMDARRGAITPWCIFDNTKYGAATTDAIGLADRLRLRRSASPESIHD